MSLLSRRRALMFIQNSILPSGYELAEYIESTGTQWIDTGFVPNQDTRVVCDFQFTSTEASFLFGSRKTAFVNAYTVNLTGGKIVTSYGKSGNSAVVNDDLDRHIVDKNKTHTSIDGAVNIREAYTFTCPGSLELFACYNDGTKGYLPSKAKMFSCAIYDNDVKVRDFIPCCRKSDKTAGLFDLVNRKFYASESEDNFIVKITDKISNYNIIDYIESTGTQYINTGVIPTELTTIEAKFSTTKNYPFGVRTSSQSKICYISDSYGVWCLRYGLTSNCTYGTVDENIHTVKMGIDGVYFDGTFVEKPVQDPFTCMGSLYLFALNNNGSPSCGNSKIYSFKMYNDGILIRNFVPCYRKSDGVIGMFDTVNNYFYENVGTGEFVTGGEV